MKDEYLTVTLRPAEIMFGIGENITAATLYVVLDNVDIIKQGFELIVSVSLKVNKEAKKLSVEQKLRTDSIIQGNRLPLNGTLWLIGKPDEIGVESSRVAVYYVHV